MVARPIGNADPGADTVPADGDGVRTAIPEHAPVVVKVGSSSLSAEGGGVDSHAITRVVAHVASLWDSGHPTVLVTSGAVAAGLPALGLRERPGDIPGLQVAAAIGQSNLMSRYAEQFGNLDRTVGQILITREVLSRREQYLHAREALTRMLEMGVVPVVNENDTVVVDELRFGDNDRLAAIVAQLVNAGMLVLLTDTAGLFSEDPALSDDARLLSAVRHTDEALRALSDRPRGTVLGSGGVSTKVAAAQMAAWSGIPTVIANATEPDVALRSVRGEEVGTWVAPHASRLPARKLWIAFGLPSEGEVVIDDGATRAIVSGGRSLLAVGVTAVKGEFDAGAAIEVTSNGEMVAKGLTGMSAIQIDGSRGQNSSAIGGEVIHRDDLVVLT